MQANPDLFINLLKDRLKEAGTVQQQQQILQESSPVLVAKAAAVHPLVRQCAMQPEFQLYWFSAYLRQSGVNAQLSMCQKRACCEAVSAKISPFQLLQGRVFYQEMLREYQAHRFDQAANACRQALALGSVHALWYYLHIIQADHQDLDFFANTAKNMHFAADYAQQFTVLFGSTAYLLLAETKARLAVLLCAPERRQELWQDAINSVNFAFDVQEDSAFMTSIVSFSQSFSTSSGLVLNSREQALELIQTLQDSTSTQDKPPVCRKLF